MNVVGFDFGTTNSLISLVRGGRAINYVDEERRPVPSVVCYEGMRTLAGRAAKERLAKAGLGVQGNAVRSPKMFLGRDGVFVEGVERSPVDMVADIVRHVVEQATRGSRGRDLGTVDAAVVTIPVDMKGHQRRALRDAFRVAGIQIQQFVHEPLAALYGHFRQGDVSSMLGHLDRRLVLVFDWGGGTLDLTLCRPMDGMVVQLKNDGTDSVGGDVFDESIRARLVQKVCARKRIDAATPVHPGAHARLLDRCERAKIELSERSSVSIFVNSYFKEVADEDFEYDLTQGELEEIVSPLLNKGFERIERLLASAGFAPEQVALCLATGGMSNMPAVKRRLHEWFGVQRVQVPDGTATLIAEGAAWIAADRAGLQLAKTVELLMARTSYLPILKAGTPMPRGGEMLGNRTFDLYCVDPRDGSAKFQFCAPMTPGVQVMSNDPRLPLAMLTIDVDASAQPFTERLRVQANVTDDLILELKAESTDLGSQARVEVHDLEFGLALPAKPSGGSRVVAGPSKSKDSIHESGSVTFRANVADRQDWNLVPGELASSTSRSVYERHTLSDIQRREHLYYQPCAVCGRRSSDPTCTCERRPARTSVGRGQLEPPTAGELR